MINDPKTLILAFLGGVIPALIWLWFWLREDKKKEEPKGLLTMIFILGMLSVILVLPIQKFLQANINSNEWQLLSFATAEELIKYLIVAVVLYKSSYIDEPLDWPIYMITAALGFAALENMLFLIQPISLDNSIVGLLTGQLRFLGSTLLHTVASGVIGISMGLSFYMESGKKKLYLFLGIIVAIVLHTVFNFFIMKNNGSDFLKVYSFLWVVTIIIMLLFERLRRMTKD
jgi:RsiW-degrading membrane proteinase PrsW (M82 family)